MAIHLLQLPYFVRRINATNIGRPMSGEHPTSRPSLSNWSRKLEHTLAFKGG